MLNALLRVQLRSLLASFTGRLNRRGQTRKSGSKVGYALLLLYCAGAFGFLFYTNFSQLAAAFVPLDLGWLYWAMYAIMAFALMFIGSVFTAKSQLFEAKDNELLLSMPIPPRCILLARMALLLVLNLVFELVAAVPAGIAWAVYGAPTAAGIAAYVLLLLALPLLSMAVTCLFAWLISLLTSRMRSKTLLTVVFSVVFLGAYFVACFRINSYITELAANGTQIAGRLIAVAPLYWMGRALAGEPAALPLVLLVCLLPFALTCWLLARSFIRIVTQKRGAAKVRYDGRALPVRSDDGALLWRELRHLTSSAPYMINDGLGLFFYPVLTVLAVVKRQQLFEFAGMLGLSDGGLAVVLLMTAIFLASTVVFTGASVSLEGKSYWIVRSLPVTTRQVLSAKLRMHNLLGLPVAGICAAVLAGVLDFGPGVGCGGFLVLGSMAAVELTGVIGLIANLRHANLTWVNEVQPIKQGAAVMITMFLDWAIALAAGLPYLFWLSDCMEAWVYEAIVVVLMQLAASIGIRWIDTRGVKYFENLA